jgi:hypoxanthine phosphoribosyltransferase
MPATIKIHDKQFAVSIAQHQIQQRVQQLGFKITEDYSGLQPVFLVVLKGAFLFAADLLRNVKLDCEITFIRVGSYEGTQSKGVVRSLLGLSEKIHGKHLVVVEDIVDTGNTVMHLVEELKKSEPQDIKIATLLLKPHALKHNIHIHYVGFSVPNDFIVGYGLDYDGLGRNLNEIYKVVS